MVLDHRRRRRRQRQIAHPRDGLGRQLWIDPRDRARAAGRPAPHRPSCPAPGLARPARAPAHGRRTTPGQRLPAPRTDASASAARPESPPGLSPAGTGGPPASRDHRLDRLRRIRRVRHSNLARDQLRQQRVSDRRQRDRLVREHAARCRSIGPSDTIGSLAERRRLAGLRAASARCRRWMCPIVVALSRGDRPERVHVLLDPGVDEPRRVAVGEHLEDVLVDQRLLTVPPVNTPSDPRPREEDVVRSAMKSSSASSSAARRADRRPRCSTRGCRTIGAPKPFACFVNALPLTNRARSASEPADQPWGSGPSSLSLELLDPDEVHEPRAEQRRRRLLQQACEPAVAVDLVVQRARARRR